MSAYRAVLLALVVVGGALVVAVPAGATHDGADASRVGVEAEVGVGVASETAVATEAVGDAGARQKAAANETTNNTSLGADISSFMQSSAAEVGGAVESGMWTAAFNATDNETVRVRLVERRTGELREELTELQRRKAELTDEREAGNLSETAYTAKVSRLLGQIHALQSAINATSSRAESVNADVETLSALRSEADNLTGPEIAAVARNVTGVGVDNGRGPPDDAGNGNGPAGTSNGAAGNGVAGTGNGDDAAGTGNGAAGAPNETTGPPNGVGPAGNETASGNETTVNATTNASRRAGPPGEADDAMVGNGNAAVMGNGNATVENGSETGSAAALANASGPPSVANNSSGTTVVSASAGTTFLSPSANAAVLATAVDATAGLFDPVSDALSVRTFPLARSMAVV